MQALALEYWVPRIGGAFIGLMGWAAMGFFNGISAVRFTMTVVVVTTVTNAIFNQLFMFQLGMGMKGSAWGTNVAQLVGVCVALAFFLGGRLAAEYGRRIMWRPTWSVIRAQLMVGLPIGVMYGADVLGLALSQTMIAQTGAVGAAATQIVMALTSMAYMPTIGIALAGTTLVGQSIGAGSRGLGQPARLRDHRVVCGAHGVHRRVAARGRALGAAAVRQQRRPRGRRRRRDRPGVAVARGRVPDLRRTVLRLRLLPARRRRHARAGDHRAGVVVVLLRAAGAHADLRARAGVGGRRATIWIGRQGRLDRADESTSRC
ncbi:MAG: MATE family efflux transporter [Nocardioides sp.]